MTLSGAENALDVAFYLAVAVQYLLYVSTHYPHKAE
jgi:hypothetical protein